MGFIEGMDRGQAALLSPCVDDYVAPDALVRVVDAFVADLDLVDLGFDRAISAATGRPGYHPADMLQRLRQSLKQQGVPTARILTKAYWAPGKRGLD